MDELRQLKLLNVVGDQGRLDVGDPKAYEAVGGDNSELSTTWDTLKRRGLVEEDPAPGLMLLYGLTAEAETDYRERLDQSSDPRARRSAIRNALLDWLTDTDDDLFQDYDAFLENPRAVIDGRRAADANEAQKAAVYLHDQGLVEVIGVNELLVVKLRITSGGRDVVDHYDGDVAAWVRRRGEGAPSVNTGGGDYIHQSNNVQTMKNSPGGQQVQGESKITAEESRELAQFTGGVRKLLTLDEVPEERRIEVAGRLDELEVAVASEERSAIRGAWSRVRAALSGAGPTLTYFMTRLVLPAVFEDDEFSEGDG